MAKANALNTNLAQNTGLPLVSGLSGNISASNYNSGINASASTYLAYDSSVPNGAAWLPFPVVEPGPQGAIAYMPRAGEYTISPHVPVTTRSYYQFNSPSTANATITNVQLNDGQFPFSQTSTWGAGTFVVGNSGYVKGGPNSLLIDYLPVVQELTSSTSVTLTNNVAYTFICNSASLLTITLTASGVNVITVIGKGTGGWRMALPAGTRFSNNGVLTSSGGSISSANYTDAAVFIANFGSSTGAVLGAPQSTGLVLA